MNEMKEDDLQLKEGRKDRDWTGLDWTGTDLDCLFLID
jgi:hypothetical protein